MTVAVFVAAIVLSIIVDTVVRRHPEAAVWWYGGWMVVCVVLSALSFAQGQTSWGLWMAACAVINGINWWLSRKRRKPKRAGALLGAKSRALIERLVMRQREAAQPSR